MYSIASTTFSLILNTSIVIGVREHEILEVLINNSLKLMWDFYIYYVHVAMQQHFKLSLGETKLLTMPD